jgi:hypothetical protein
MDRWNRNKTRKVRNKTAPVQIPPFHYTKSQERRAWTCAIYPHAEIFLRAVGSIDWSNFKYNENGTSASFSKNPYYALGGSVEELYNILYKKDISPGEELHKRVDPTADLDVRICPMKASNYRFSIQSYYLEEYYRKEDATIRIQPFAEAAANFLVDELVAYFKPMERKLNSIFLTALPFKDDYDTQSKGAQRKERVGPLTVIYTNFLQDAGKGYFTPLTKVQVKLTIPQPDLIARAATEGRNFYKYTKHIIQDHVIELGFWEAPNTLCAHESFLYRPYNLRLRDLKGEIFGCFNGLRQRLEFIYHPEYIHKSLNYVYRLRFLLKILYSVWGKVRKNRPNAYGIDRWTLENIGETLQALLEFIYSKTSEEKRLSIWFVYLEILRILDEPITNYMNMPLAMRRVQWFFDRLYIDYTPEQIRDIETRIGSTDIDKVKLEMYNDMMDATRERYLLRPPIGCDEATPAERPLVEAEKARLNAIPHERGPTLAELSALPKNVQIALREEHRGRPTLSRETK